MPQHIRSRWWWSMPPDRLRVALALRDLLSRSNPLAVDFHMLSTVLTTSRATIMRTLDELARARLIHTKTTAGRHGGTEAILLVREWFCEPDAAQFSNDTNAQDYETNETAPRRAEQLSGQFPEQFNQPVLDLPDSPKNPDQDPSSELSERTPTSQQKQTTAPANMTPPATSPTDTNPQGKRPKIDPAKIPPPAWRAADGLRAQILKHDPAHKLGTVKWDDETGMRAKWAHTLDLMNRVDKREWGEIAGVIRWLYPDDALQGPSQAARMFVIFSPDSLREKFDRVQAARRREHGETRGRTPADTRQPPAFKQWGGSGGGS